MCYSMYTLCAGCIIACIATLPPWHCFRCADNITWLEPYPEEPVATTNAGKKS